MKRRRAIREFKNIRVLPSGYQVTIVRVEMEFSRHFAGHSERSRRAAVRFRDQLLRELPDKRRNKIPRRVLLALNLKKPVVGVFRHRKKSYYAVSYRDRGNMRSRTFGWSDGDEVEAYAAAIGFRNRSILRQ